MFKYATFLKKDSLYNTPPAFNIYMVGKVAHWILEQGGLPEMAKRNKKKADRLYGVIDASNGFYRGHAEKESRSFMNVTFRLPSEELEKTFVAEALAQGLTDAVSFRTHDGLASALIINGEVQSKNLGGGVNPRTAIGQCDDGSVLLLVLDGRSINTLGATMQDVADIMLEYGAVNAGNLDGGSSSVMVYGGEIINNCASVTGPRNIPTAFIVLPEGA